MKTAYVILGNQLLRSHPAISDSKDEDNIIMIEAHDICSKFNYHKHKLVLVLSAMRDYRDHLLSLGKKVTYIELNSTTSFMRSLEEILIKQRVTELRWMETSDASPQEKIIGLCTKLNISYATSPNRQFITSTESFDEWHTSQKKPLMESFYRWQRKRTGILMNSKQPEGGEWNYDHENRKPLPKSAIAIPPLPTHSSSKHSKDVAEIVERHFPQNPGNVRTFWLPTNFTAADEWLDCFIHERSSLFGDYEDASQDGEPFLFHSVLSPMLNCGLLEPNQIVNAALDAYKSGAMPLNSCEGFIRQVIGWREYMNGMYHMMPELKDANYFEFTKELEDWWYTEEFEQQELPIPLKSVLRTVHTYGYNHHIERLMVLGNWFLLNEYSPKSVYKWFSSMYVDAYDWVMVPNVQGMSQYADGGHIATKPYISGGNYLQKMGRWWPSLDQAKKSDYNTLYWKFLIANKDKLADNPRMSIMLKMAEKQGSSKP